MHLTHLGWETSIIALLPLISQHRAACLPQRRRLIEGNSSPTKREKGGKRKTGRQGLNGPQPRSTAKSSCYNSCHFESFPWSAPLFCHNTITGLRRLQRRCRRVEVLEEKIAAARTAAGVKYHFVSLKMDSAVRFQRTSTESKWRSLKGGDKKGKSQSVCVCVSVSF